MVPEHTTLVPSRALCWTGDYVIRVHYFSDHSTGQSITGTVSIVVNEGTAQQVVRK